MKHGQLSREEAVKAAGTEAVEKVEALGCHPTSRCQTDGDNDIEYSASVSLPAGGTLVACYYIDGDWYASLPDDVDAEDLCGWEIHGFEVI